VIHLHEEKDTDMSLQPVSRLTAVQRRGARLIVVSNRLPLTLQKTEEGSFRRADLSPSWRRPAR